MARHSLSWYKKRTAALNKALGTSYSPTQIMNAPAGVIEGYFEMVGDPRSKGAQSAYEQAAVRLMQEEKFKSLSAHNAFVHTVLPNAGELISQDRRTVYVRVGGGYVAIDSHTGQERKIQRADELDIELAEVLTARLIYQLVTEKARQIKGKRDHNAIDGYLYD